MVSGSAATYDSLLSIINIYILVDFSGDHLGMSADLVFAPCDSERCHKIPINDDMIVEQPESFFVTLERSDGLDDRIRLHRDFTNKEVTILDNDSKWNTNMQVHVLWIKPEPSCKSNKECSCTLTYICYCVHMLCIVT